ncbi:general odorant-binding protein 28a-like isoform X2 [Anastrepha ludens]|uniref:general odorant-binding protein 28a-like isoform X2 n=1 Tax=Anastrepha ludens TaxID=28586 RepID=UPI0023AF2AA7|nr:general odorant-binding protein 28a-like isoform X2 [Anastrepha ludens]
MKYFLVFLVICSLAISYAEDIQQKIKKIANDCKAESGGSDADIDALLKHQPAGSDKAKCLMTCFMKNFGLIDAGAKIDQDSALNVIKAVANGDANIEKLGKELIDACKDTPAKGNECESGEAVRECVIAKAKANGFKLPW